jgi:hypothetical protein
METKTKLGQTPAAPFFTWNEGGYGNCFSLTDKDGNKQFINYEPGMTIRQKLGSDVLCALLSNPAYKGMPTLFIVEESLSITDTFLKLESE